MTITSISGDRELVLQFTSDYDIVRGLGLAVKAQIDLITQNIDHNYTRSHDQLVAMPYYRNMVNLSIVLSLIATSDYLLSLFSHRERWIEVTQQIWELLRDVIRSPEFTANRTIIDLFRDHLGRFFHNYGREITSIRWSHGYLTLP